MSTQGQGDVAQQSLEERVSQFHTCRLPGQAGIHMGTAALIDDLWKEILTQRDAARKSQSHADRLRTLLSSSRGEQHQNLDILRRTPLSAERARVIEECARVAGEKSAMLPHQNDFVRGYANGRADAAAALRALGQQDTGGADHG